MNDPELINLIRIQFTTQIHGLVSQQRLNAPTVRLWELSHRKHVAEDTEEHLPYLYSQERDIAPLRVMAIIASLSASLAKKPDTKTAVYLRGLLRKLSGKQAPDLIDLLADYTPDQPDGDYQKLAIRPWSFAKYLQHLTHIERLLRKTIRTAA